MQPRNAVSGCIETAEEVWMEEPHVTSPAKPSAEADFNKLLGGMIVTFEPKDSSPSQEVFCC